MLDKQQRVVPKGEARKRLEKEDRVQVVKFYREMDDNELQQTILNAFKWVRSYTVLACEGSGHTLIDSSKQRLSGDDVTKRRGPLYLAVKECDDYVVSIRDDNS